MDNLLSWRHSGFSAHGAVRVEDRQGAVRLGRYMIRCPIVVKRLSWETEAGAFVYRSRPSRRGAPDGGHARWDVLEFLARVLDPGGRHLSFAKTLFRVRKPPRLAVRGEVSPLKQNFVGCRPLRRAASK